MSALAIEEITAPNPASLFAGLRQRRGSFFLDSGLNAQALGTYSFIGFDPFLTFEASGRRVCLREHGGEAQVIPDGDPLSYLRGLIRRYRSDSHSQLPFVGGAVGYFAYEWGSRWEIQSKHRVTDQRPDVELGFYDGVLAYSHATGRWWLVANPVHKANAVSILQRLRAAVAEAATFLPRGGGGSPLAEPLPDESRERYLHSVRRIKDYIQSGDVYQVNLAQRFCVQWTGDPYELYVRLRERSPAPFASFLSTRQGHAISCSPERFISLRQGRVETRPIKGTRPRGHTPADDARLAHELVTSVKDRAELLMIVDLERNDLGRICVCGSIQVEDLYRLEAHPTVFHLVATVSGNLRPDCDVLDLVRATFPGGSITGAPKIRAMQIIDELESTPRHLYTGAIGYLGFDGSCDLAIAIRTIVTRPGEASYHVGAGIVWDSDPESEYEETLAKGRALRAALIGKEEAS